MEAIFNKRNIKEIFECACGCTLGAVIVLVFFIM